MKIPSNKVKDIRRYMRANLAAVYEERSIDIFAGIILETYAGIRKDEMYLYPEKTVSESVLLKINTAIKLLKKEMPVEYITGIAYFFGLKFKVSKKVLIPRPETEELVQWVINNKGDAVKDIKILDAATGSGSIAIALKKNIPNAEVFAFDISKDALEIAILNAVENSTPVHFFVDDLINFTNYSQVPEIDILVCNPPYIRSSEKKLMQKNVLDYEPHQALFVEDDNPLLNYKGLAVLGQKLLKDKGILICEINEALGSETAKVFEGTGYNDVTVIKDINEKDRFVSCVKTKV